ncbi:hypothetical protein [Paracoccus sanguinis]|uniref:Uncharacterized protein n=1 Tax=Paracoccus sanguinis TaxID=1545044 RepID=A0A1H3BRA2_9RHOB|nr:hypothetical protein [Paracoccus sanguinis]SDX44238.1 hypothetical protein SAMN05444276_106122 [Paracoccus sanguinis]
MADSDRTERQLGSKQPNGEQVSTPSHRPTGDFSMRPSAETVVVRQLATAPAKPKEKD